MTTDAALWGITALQLLGLFLVLRVSLRRRRAPWKRTRFAFYPWFLQWGAFVLAGCVRHDPWEIATGGALVGAVLWMERREREIDRAFAAHPGLEEHIERTLYERYRASRRKP